MTRGPGTTREGAGALKGGSWTLLLVVQACVPQVTAKIENICVEMVYNSTCATIAYFVQTLQAKVHLQYQLCTFILCSLGVEQLL